MLSSSQRISRWCLLWSQEAAHSTSRFPPWQVVLGAERSRKRRISCALQPHGAEHSLILWCPTFAVSICHDRGYMWRDFKASWNGAGLSTKAFLSCGQFGRSTAKQSKISPLIPFPVFQLKMCAVKTHFEQIARALQSPKVGRIPKPRCEFARWKDANINDFFKICVLCTLYKHHPREKVVREEPS